MLDQSKNIAIVGLGYVGLPLSLLADQKGYKVTGIDIDQKKIDLLKEKKSPFKDEAIEESLKTSNITFTRESSAVEKSDIVIICVPTPVYEDKMPNLEPVEGACRAIAPYLRDGHVVVLESTVNPGVCDEIVIPLLETASGLKAGKNFHVVHCPERINPGDSKWTVANINRVIGSNSEYGLYTATEFYSSIITGTVKQMGSLKEAEAVKIVENSFRDINIAFVNELAKSFDKLGIDVVNVIDGAATKPFAFMPHYPGCGVGGHCIPVDPYYLIEYAKKNGFSHEFLKLARNINSSMPEYTVSELVWALNEKTKTLKGSKIAVLGLAYKKNIDDYRESPSFEIIEELTSHGAEVTIFDPFVQSKSNVSTLDEALSGVDGIILATDHTQFKEALTPELLKEKSIDVIIDGRNCLNKKSFIGTNIIYKGIGR